KELRTPRDALEVGTPVLSLTAFNSKPIQTGMDRMYRMKNQILNPVHPVHPYKISPPQSGTLTVFIISRRTSSASSLRRWSEFEKRELTTRRCAKTGRTRRLMSSGRQ